MFLTKILEEQNSKYNGSIRVVKTFGSDAYIQANGLTQSGGIVETIWKQTLKKVKKTKQNINTCLILGLGGGTVAKLVRKNWPKVKITGVDIDPIMTNLGSRYLDLDSQKVDIKIMDAFDYLNRNKNKKYDLIIADLYNGDKFPEKFATKHYIQLAGSLLSEEGMIVFNRLYFGSRYSYSDKKSGLGDFEENLQKVFTKVDRFHPVSNIMFLCLK